MSQGQGTLDRFLYESDGSTTDDTKRKRESPDADPSKRSKKNAKSPKEDGGREDKKIDELKAMMMIMMGELREIRKAQERYSEEMSALKTENENLKGRVEKLEARVEISERSKRKKNIVIKGLEIRREVKDEVACLLQKIGADHAEVVSTRKVERRKGGSIVIAEMRDWEAKREVMRSKNKLKGSQVYIDDDYTDEEWKVQSRLIGMAREERKKGGRAVVGYNKVTINGEVWKWNAQLGAVEKAELVQQGVAKN